MDENEKKVVKQTQNEKKELQQDNRVESFTNNHVEYLTLLNLATEIIDKQYRRYSMADTKTFTLVTSNSILLTTIGLLFKEALNDKFTLVFIILSLISVSISLYFALKQVIPLGSSGLTNTENPNIRSQNGILSYKKWEEYKKAFLSISANKLMEMNVRQIFGMSHNIKVNLNKIRNGVIFTIISFALVLLTFTGIVLANYNIHLFGEKISINNNLNKQIINTCKIQVDSVKKKDTLVKKLDILKNGRIK
ncbi:MAG: hypothetical protein NTZ33_02360 [Bacteroidetes bacterium]|nr:hypothetical protein [Bacteroidota bacterium]